MLSRLTRALADPVRTGYVLRAGIDPAGLMRRYGRLARRQGFDRLYFVLSFDCDSPEDYRVVGDLHARLADMGAAPVYAVPGQLIEEGEAEYRRVFDAGAEFINHGYRQHTYFDEALQDWASCFFYDQLPEATVREDIVAGDACLRRVFGSAPKGFRTPHFGSFQRRRHLDLLHGTVRELGYSFSTSTSPVFAFRYGPVFRHGGVAEIPVSGMGTAPLTILDSWSCFRAPGRTLGPADFSREAALSAGNFTAAGAGLLNFYADPSHVHDRPEFFEAVRRWLEVATPVTYAQLLERIGWNSAS